MDKAFKEIEKLVALIADYDFIDLSPTIEKNIPRWPSHPHLVIDQTVTHEHGDGYYCQTISMAEHTGAHVDASSHSVPTMMDHTIEKVPVDFFCASAVVYDLRPLNLQPGDQATGADFEKIERQMGFGVQEGEIALLCFGWDKYWTTDRTAQFYALNEPGLDKSGVEFFLNRKVRAVGSDNIACDIAVKDGIPKENWGHENLWLPNGILIIEEMINLDKLPAKCYFIALPLKIKAGSGSPVRPVALVPKETENR